MQKKETYFLISLIAMHDCTLNQKSKERLTRHIF